MKQLMLCLLLSLCSTAWAQQRDDYWNEKPKSKSQKIYDNELGFRFDSQLNLGDGAAPELQVFSVDYAHYYFCNIGFRTGLNIFLDDEITNYFSIPMQFTWRSPRWKNLMLSPGQTPAGFGVGLLSLLIPKQVELHTGFTPGAIMGGRHEWPSDENPWLFKHRFTCTYDLGGRLIFPVWRFNLLFDFTYHRYLTDNFRRGRFFYPSRSYMSLGGGLSFNF